MQSLSLKSRVIKAPSWLRVALPAAVVGIVGFIAGPSIVTFAITAWDQFFYPALVQVSLSGLRWCM